MIRIFRQFRKTIFSGHPIAKYVLYAMGEILLVMIGILLALEVNNRNQDMLDRKESLEYHKRLIADLEGIIAFTENNATFAEKVEDHIKKGIFALENSTYTDSTKQILDFALGNYFRLSRHTRELASYEEMKSSGKLGLIYNVRLRDKIADFLTLYDLASTVSNDLNEKVNQHSFLDPYVKFGQDGNFFNEYLEYDMEQLAADKTVINILSRYAFHWNAKYKFSNDVRESAKALKTALEDEVRHMQS